MLSDSFNHNIQSLLDGSLPPQQLIDTLIPPSDETSVIFVAVPPEQFSASLLAKAVEDADVQLTGLSITSLRSPQGSLVVALRVAARTPASVIRSLERYDVSVISAKGASDSPDPDRQRAELRAAELLHYLEL